MDIEGNIQSQVLQATLSEISTRNHHSGDHSTESCCVICLDSVTEPCEAQPCKHQHFDYLCLVSWLQEQTKCPLCKTDITQVWYDFQGDDRSDHAVYTVPAAQSSSQSQSQSQTQSHRLPNRPPRAYRQRHEARPQRPLAENDPIRRRRNIYRNNLYSLRVGSNPRSGHRELTPQIFTTHPEMLSRARAWLRHELQVFEFLHTPDMAQSSDDAMTRRRANNAEFLLEYIIAILRTVDIQGSQGQAEEMLKDFFGRANARLLLHELKNFLRSPWSVESWDRKVQYPAVGANSRWQAHPEEEAEGEDKEEFHTRPARRNHLDRAQGKQRVWDTYRPDYSRRRDRQAAGSSGSTSRS
ncbi:hypothetical protein F4778DRAFT_732436 [Xylariomycetidae sp. FL2044]|nr:hypothetical protein F4778DRAFT_732436 [Xylariomycetidae sp. FL2044]